MHRPTSKFLLPLATLAGGALVGFQVGSSRARHKKPAESKSTSTEVQQSLNHSRAIHHGSAVPSVEASASDPAPRLADSLIARLRQLQAHPAMRWGVPSFASDVLVSDRLVIGFDRRARNPSWVAERLTAGELDGSQVSRKGLRFREESRVHPKFRALLTDYSRSGYDRGHLAPAADHKCSRSAMADTFTLANISPQVGQGFNRHYWARFEAWTRNLVRLADVVYVVSGPLYLPRKGDDGKWQTSHPRIGDYPGVAVPTHFFKAILVEKDGQIGVGAFVLPNRPIPEATPLSDFVSTIDAIDRAGGLLLFNLIPSQEGGVQPLGLDQFADYELPAPNWWQEKAKVAASRPESTPSEHGAAKALPAPGPADGLESPSSGTSTVPSAAPVRSRL